MSEMHWNLDLSELIQQGEILLLETVTLTILKETRLVGHHQDYHQLQQHLPWRIPGSGQLQCAKGVLREFQRMLLK